MQFSTQTTQLEVALLPHKTRVRAHTHTPYIVALGARKEIACVRILAVLATRVRRRRRHVNARAQKLLDTLAVNIHRILAFEFVHSIILSSSLWQSNRRHHLVPNGLI